MPVIHLKLPLCPLLSVLLGMESNLSNKTQRN
jgi:hypothetical protein